MDYKQVRRSHVVTRGYLHGFSRDGIVALHLVSKPGDPREVPVGKAGVLLLAGGLMRQFCASRQPSFSVRCSGTRLRLREGVEILCAREVTR